MPNSDPTGRNGATIMRDGDGSVRKWRSRGSGEDWTPIKPTPISMRTGMAFALMKAQAHEERVVVTLIGGGVKAGRVVSHHNDLPLPKDPKDKMEASNLRFVLDTGEQFALANVIRVE